MSRSKHQRNQTFRGRKYPRRILYMYFKDGYRNFRERKIKMKPYGRKNFIGYGEEVYSSKFGEYFITMTDKKSERQTAKKELRNELNLIDN